VLYKILYLYHLVTMITEHFHEKAIQENLLDRKVFPCELVTDGSSYSLAHDIDQTSDLCALEFF